MSDEELFRSAKLYDRDYTTGEEGFNLAAVLLLGKDEVISSVCPAYITDAVVRRDNIDRYDDRLMVRTNLFDSYEQLREFTERNLPDRFVLKGDKRVSPRTMIARELVANSSCIGSIPVRWWRVSPLIMNPSGRLMLRAHSLKVE